MDMQWYGLLTNIPIVTSIYISLEKKKERKGLECNI